MVNYRLLCEVQERQDNKFAILKIYYFIYILSLQYLPFDLFIKQNLYKENVI